MTFDGYKQTNRERTTNYQFICKVVILVGLVVCLFVCPIITHEPLDRLVANFDCSLSEHVSTAMFLHNRITSNTFFSVYLYSRLFNLILFEKSYKYKLGSILSLGLIYGLSFRIQAAFKLPTEVGFYFHWA